MNLIPFDYNVWSMNKGSLECFCVDSIVYSLIQHSLPNEIRLVGYLYSEYSNNKFVIFQWCKDGEIVGSMKSDIDLKLMMKWKEKK